MNQQDNQSDERFVAVHVDKLGVEELNPDLPQIQDIVRPFLPQDYKYLFALNASREIVNGFKYEIIFAMQNEKNDLFYCEMDVLEKPWLIKDSRKFRKMTYNNCSLENPIDDEDKIIEYEVNPTFLNQRTQLTEDDLREMEDQIVTVRPDDITTSIMDENDEDETTLAPLNPSSKNLLDDFFNMNKYFPPPQVPSTNPITTTASPALTNFNMDALDEMFGMKKVANSQAETKVNNDESERDNLQQKRIETIETTPTKNETALKDLETEIKKVFSELFQTDPEFQMNIIALINRKDDSTAQKNYNYAINILATKLKDKIEMFNVRKQIEDDAAQVTADPLSESGDIRKKRSSSKNIWDIAESALLTLDHFDSDDKKRILLNILNVKQSNGQTTYKIEASIANSHCQENSHETGICEERIDLDSMKICLLEVIILLVFSRVAARA